MLEVLSSSLPNAPNALCRWQSACWINFRLTSYLGSTCIGETSRCSILASTSLVCCTINCMWRCSVFTEFGDNSVVVYSAEPRQAEPRGALVSRLDFWGVFFFRKWTHLCYFLLASGCWSTSVEFWSGISGRPTTKVTDEGDHLL